MFHAPTFPLVLLHQLSWLLSTFFSHPRFELVEISFETVPHVFLRQNFFFDLKLVSLEQKLFLVLVQLLFELEKLLP